MQAAFAGVKVLDLSRLLPGTARPAMRRIEKITGRNDDFAMLTRIDHTNIPLGRQL